MRVEYWDEEGPYKAEFVLKNALPGILSDIRKSALKNLYMSDLCVYALFDIKENMFRVWTGGYPMSESELADLQDPNLVVYVLRR